MFPVFDVMMQVKGPALIGIPCEYLPNFNLIPIANYCLNTRRYRPLNPLPLEGNSCFRTVDFPLSGYSLLRDSIEIVNDVTVYCRSC